MTTLLLLPPYFNTTTTTTLFLIFFTLFHCYLSAAISVVDQAPPVMTTPAGSQLIPAFPEQADVNARCPLSLSDEHFNGIKSACGDKKDKVDPILHRSRCCPVLAAWLYSAYSATGLGLGLGHSNYSHTTTTTNSYGYDDNNMPLLPDDSETCDLGKALKDRGIELVQPNETCDMVYCYCGIRLHPLSCPESFSVTTTTAGRRNLVPHQTVQTLETNCLTGVGGCNNCLHSLFLLVSKAAAGSSSKANSTKLLLSEEEQRRKKKIHKKDCELMGLTWLLAKNRKAYIHTVTQVLRAFMLTRDDDDASASASDPISCTLNSDGMPLAVDSSEIMYDHNSSSTSTIIINLQPQPKLLLVLLLLMHFILSTIY